jgi:hypothetical protein
LHQKTLAAGCTHLQVDEHRQHTLSLSLYAVYMVWRHNYWRSFMIQGGCASTMSSCSSCKVLRGSTAALTDSPWQGLED